MDENDKIFFESLLLKQADLSDRRMDELLEKSDQRTDALLEKSNQRTDMLLKESDQRTDMLLKESDQRTDMLLEKSDQRTDMLLKESERRSDALWETLDHKLDLIVEGQQMLAQQLERMGLELKEGISNLDHRVTVIAADLSTHKADTVAHHGIYRVKEDGEGFAE